MKKTGSIRVDIKNAKWDESLYRIIDSPWYRDEGGSLVVNKSAVTDIREEVDWSKVKRGAPVVSTLAGLTAISFLVGTAEHESGLLLSSYREEARKGIASHQRKASQCTLLTDWLKEHGGQDE